MIVGNINDIREVLRNEAKSIVNSTYDTIVDFASAHDVEYPTACIVERSHTIGMNDRLNRYTFLILIVDRGYDDVVAVSDRCSVLAEKLVRRINEYVTKIDNVTITPFYDNHSDAFSGVSIQLSMYVCSPICSLSI